MNITFDGGLPPAAFYGEKGPWASEPLTQILTQTDISYALPDADKNMSLVAKNDKGEVIGQCSANKATTYWEHVETRDPKDKHLHTQLFIKIHQKAVQVERAYLKEIGESEQTALHSAGIAVHEKYRGNGIGLNMRERQIELCKEHRATILFCETTNQFSATTVREKGFKQLAEFSYSKLAKDLDYQPLNGLKVIGLRDSEDVVDSFRVWCLRLSQPASDEKKQAAKS